MIAAATEIDGVGRNGNHDSSKSNSNSNSNSRKDVTALMKNAHYLDYDRLPKEKTKKLDQQKYLKKIRKAKRKARSNLDPDQWDRHDYHDQLHQFWTFPEEEDQVPRVHCKNLSCEEFVTRFETQRVPVVIQGLSDHWPANENWTIENLYKNYRNKKFRCGEDDDGNGIYMKLKYFFKYCSVTKDDSPLYIFDSNFADRSGTTQMRYDYLPPPYFDEDFFALGGDSHRPPYRWIVIGPAGSGTNIHVDPLGTSAWNTLIKGHKRWVLFPPQAEKSKVEPPKMEDEAFSWFMTVYPKTKESSWSTCRPVSLIQYPGDTVFVPVGWWHVVMNLDMTVAVTQNFCSRSNFEEVWLKARSGRPKFSSRVLSQLRKYYPEIAKKTVELETVPYLYDSSSSSSSSESEDEELPTTARQSELLKMIHSKVPSDQIPDRVTENGTNGDRSYEHRDKRHKKHKSTMH